MASISRTGLLRQTQLLKPSQRLFSTASTSRTLRIATPLVSRQIQAPRSILQCRIAPFATTGKKNILPPGPQIINGGVNDPVPLPAPHPTHGSYHWTFERLISIGLIPLTVAPFAAGSLNPTMDAVFVAALLIHSHIGFESCVVDYFSTITYPTLRKIMNWVLRITTILVGVGLYEFETNDVGITEGVKRIWRS